MLERFDSVSNVGLFDAYVHSAGCEFGGVTLIYGENGVGKSTLAAILDSLRERSAGEIVTRRRLPGDSAPTVAVRMDGKVYTFNGQDWDAELPHDTLEVFFPGFVTRNVHAAKGIDPENRRNLCEFVFGRIAIEKLKRLTQADNEGRDALRQKDAIDRELQLLIKKPHTLETFLGLPKDEVVDEHIEQVRAELRQAQSKVAILARPVPEAVVLPTVDRRQIARLLEKSSDAIGAGCGTLVRAHITQHLDNEGEKWLAYGAKHTGIDNKCPFCAQDIAGSGLATAIRSYFSTEYRVYTEVLSEETGSINDQLGRVAFQNLRARFSVQAIAATQWVDELPFDQHDFESALAGAEVIWESAAEKLQTIVARKQATPLERIDPACADAALGDYDRALAMLEKLNVILSASGKKAEARRTALSGAETAEIEQRLHRLENQKVRFEPLAQGMLEKRIALIEKRTQRDNEKGVLKKDIDDLAARIVGRYQEGINYYLKHFGCDIRIESVESRFPSGRAIVQYKLKVHEYEFDLGLSETGPCFATILSEGDKYTLALSFFLARLKDHSDLTGRVVVLDDPANSFGNSRRTLIEGVIRDLRVRGAQVVVLTHDELLAAMIWRDRKLKGTVTLQVARTGRGSQLRPWDADRATRTEYVEHYLTLSDYLTKGGDYKRAAGCIRPYVEQRLRHLFPGPASDTHDALGDMINKIRSSPVASRLHPLKEKLSDLEAIKDAALPSHHATDGVPGMQPLTPDAVRIFAQKALEVLG